MARTMREGGLRTTRGTVMPTMQAVALGGGSLVNSAICVRAPDFVLERWCTDYELAHTTRADLDPHYDAVGAFLGISPTPEDSSVAASASSAVTISATRSIMSPKNSRRSVRSSSPSVPTAVSKRSSGGVIRGRVVRARIY